MIFTIPLTFIYFIFSGLIAILPDSAGLPDAISEGFSYVFGFVYAFDFLLPVSAILTVLGISLAFELAIQIWHLIHWIIRKIPVANVK